VTRRTASAVRSVDALLLTKAVMTGFSRHLGAFCGSRGAAKEDL